MRLIGEFKLAKKEIAKRHRYKKIKNHICTYHGCRAEVSEYLMCLKHRLKVNKISRKKKNEL